MIEIEIEIEIKIKEDRIRPLFVERVDQEQRKEREESVERAEDCEGRRGNEPTDDKPVKSDEDVKNRRR